MSQPRFASITASLLARKGQASPWAEPTKLPLAWERGELPAAAPGGVGFFKSPSEPSPVHVPANTHGHAHGTGFFKSTPPQPELAPVHGPGHAHGPTDWKKVAIRMSHHDYERLGILAVKQDKTRQRLLHEAVDRLLAGITLKYSAGCACLGEERFASGERS